MMEKQKLINAAHVAERLGCSQRHVWRMRDAGKMPAPITLGRMVRWRDTEVSEWISGGCRPVRQTLKPRRR